MYKKNLFTLLITGVVFIALALVILISSCRKENVSNRSNKEQYIVPKEVAVALAYNIDRSSYPSGKEGSVPHSGSDSNIVLPPDHPDYFTLYDSDSIPALYVINFGNDSGYAIISADYRYQPVCALVPEGSGLHEGDTIPSALDNWISVVIEEIEIVRQGLYDNSVAAFLEWNEHAPFLETLNLIIPVEGPELIEPGCGPYTHYTKGPLLGTLHWGQGCTFNDLVPNKSCNTCSTNDNAPTGCVATAMAQVMRYWGQPSANYNFATMPLTSGDFEVQRLMEDCGKYVNMSYACSGSGAIMNNADNALRNKFNYNSAKYANYNFFTTRDNINADRPVILGGNHTIIQHRFLFVKWYSYDDGHAWVADGFRRSGNLCHGTQHLHMNWGWRNVDFPNINHNGWFSVNNWFIPGNSFNFQYSKDMIYDIQP